MKFKYINKEKIEKVRGLKEGDTFVTATEEVRNKGYSEEIFTFVGKAENLDDDHLIYYEAFSHKKSEIRLLHPEVSIVKVKPVAVEQRSDGNRVIFKPKQ